MPLKRSAPSRLSTERIWADGRSTSMKRGRKVKEAVAAAALAAVSAAIAAAADPGNDASHAGNGAGVKTRPVLWGPAADKRRRGVWVCDREPRSRKGKKSWRAWKSSATRPPGDCRRKRRTRAIPLTRMQI